MVAVKVVTGDFSKTPLAEVLQVLTNDKETATLICRNKETKRALFLWRGQLCDAESNVRGESLIDVLRTMDKIDPEQYAKILDQEGGNKSPAQLLVEQGVLPVREVIAFIRVQIAGVLNGLFEDGEGIFKLILGEVPDRGFSVRVPLAELILSAVKHIPTTEKLVGYLGKLDRKAQVQAGKTIDKNWHLDPQEEEFALSLKSKPTYQSLLDKNPAQAKETAAMLYALEILGYLTPGEGKKSAPMSNLRQARAEARKEEEKVQDQLMLPKPQDVAGGKSPKQEAVPQKSAATPAAASAAPAVTTASTGTALATVNADLEIYSSLESMTLYQLLQIEPSAAEGEVKSAYFRLAKIYHPDRFFGQGPEKLEQIRRIFEAQSRAYNTLRDAAARRDYDRSLEAKRQGKIPVEVPKEPEGVVRGRINYQQAVQAIEVKNYQAAVDALHRATDANPQESSYWGMLAEVQSRFARWKNEAMVAIERALELKPDKVEYLFLYGQMLSKQSDFDGAARVLRRAVTIDRNNARVREFLEEVESKGGGKKGAKGQGKDRGGLFGRLFGKGEDG